MLFKDINPLILYRGQMRCPVPKGDPVGKGECLCLLTPSSENSMKMLGEGTFLYYKEGLYKRYFIDQLYHRKIGDKMLNIRTKSSEFESFKTHTFASPLINTPKGSIRSVAKTKVNLIYDLGKWHELYFNYRKKRSPLIMANNYLNFLIDILQSDFLSPYNCTIVIDVSDWSKYFNAKTTFSASTINNPLTILLFMLYKDPETISTMFEEYNFIIMNSKDKCFVKFSGKDLVKENFSKIKRSLAIMTNNSMDVDLIENVSEKTETQLAKAKVINNEEIEKISELKVKLKNAIAKNFIGEVENTEEATDITKKFNDEEDSNELDTEPEIYVDDAELNEEIENAVDEIIEEKSAEEIEELLENNDEIITKTAIDISKKVYVNRFMPEYTKVQQNRINRLTEKQNSVLASIPAKDFLKSKIIDEEDLTEAVNTPNSEYLNLTFANMDRSYLQKKLESDIDQAVGILSKASKKIFVTEKKVEDTSTQLTLKETRTYHLEDEDGKKATIKFDVPKVVDNHYIYVNGNKKLLHHQLVAKPIIKNKPNQVKINSFYNKIIIERAGLNDALVSPIISYLLKNDKQFNVKVGNSERKNTNYSSTLEMGIVSKQIYSFEVNNWLFITHIDGLYDHLTKNGIQCKKPTKTVYPIGYNTKTKEVLYFNTEKDSYGEMIIGAFDEEDILAINKKKVPSNQFYSRCEVMEKKIPTVLLLMHTLGLTETLKLANIENEWIPKGEIASEMKKKLKEYDPHIWDQIELEDGVLVWKRTPIENSMLMSGIKGARLDFTNFTREEMDSKDTYIFSLNRIYNHSNMSYNLDQYAEFMIDEVTREILEDFNLPTTYPGLLLLANKLLCDLNYIPETDMRNLRVRSTELISYHIYKAVTEAYNEYRKSSHRMFSKKMSIKQNKVMSQILKSSLSEEESVINPFMEVEKTHAITYRGESGIGLDRAMTLDKRAYNESMLGVLGITSSNDGNIGIARVLTVEPLITSTRGYLDFKGKKDVKDLTAANLLTPGELLTPLGVEHDDPARTAMAVKQSKQMIPIDDSEPGMITNGFDRVMPYHLSKEFTIIAEDNGVVVESKDNLVVIKYNNGRYQTIDTSPTVKKNGAAGFWIVTNMKCDKKKGDVIKKNEVIGYENSAFSKNSDDLSATMRRGPFIKIAMAPRWDCYEDSNPITAKTSNRLASTMAMEENAVIKANAKVQYIAKVGDKINAGDPLIKFDEYDDDPDVKEFMELMRSKLDNEDDSFIDSAVTSVKAHHSGEIVDIKIYSSVPVEDMSPSMREIVEAYYGKLNKKINTLKKYKNPEDNNYYMSGQFVSEFPEPIEPDARGLLKGHRVEDQVLFCFFIKFKDYIKKGDKITAEFALKGIDSQVIPDGLEPYSEYRPDEEIGLIIAPHTPTARKTTAIFKSMFINKLLIEKKRQLTEYWNSVKNTFN